MAPQSVMKPMPHHTAARRRGEPNDLAIAAGVRKMPSAIDSPVTTERAAAKPICRRCSIREPCYASEMGSPIHQRVEMAVAFSC
jgi:hypothetical protein